MKFPRLSIVGLARTIQRMQWKLNGLEPNFINIDADTTLHAYVSTAITTPSSKNNIAKKKSGVVLLIHGFNSDSLFSWDASLVSSLSAHFHLIIPDLVFFGKSTTTSPERSEVFQADCVKKLLDHLGIVNSVTVVGHSYGGMVSFWLAQRYPHLVSKVALVSSGICLTAQDNEALLQKTGAPDTNTMLVPPDIDSFIHNIKFIHHKPPQIPYFLWKDIYQVMGGNKERRRELLQAMVIGSENAQPLPTLFQEVLLVWGESDQIFPLEQAHRVHRHLGEKCQLVVLEDCGHVPQREKAQAMKGFLLNFL